jgi:hypothetical protein
MSMEQFMNTPQAGMDAISEGEFRTMPDDDQDDYLAMTDADVTPEMLTADVVEEMRWWLADCTLPDGYEASSMDTDEIISFVRNGYDGGIPQFLADGAQE